MVHARRTGRGVFVNEWRSANDESGHDAALSAVVDWCRSVIGSTRRPWGIDHFDLAVAFRALGATPVHSRRFLKLRPIDLYGESFVAQLQHLFLQHSPQPQGVHVAVALFSWGEAAHNALPN